MKGRSRKFCGYCRFKKCLDAGMRPELVLQCYQEMKCEGQVGNKNNYESFFGLIPEKLSIPRHLIFPLTHSPPENALLSGIVNNVNTISRFQSITRSRETELYFNRNANLLKSSGLDFTQLKACPGLDFLFDCNRSNSSNSSGGSIDQHYMLHKPPSPQLEILFSENRSVKHEYLWLRNRCEPGLKFKIIDIFFLASNQYDVVIEIPVTDGIIDGTSIVFNHLFKNQRHFDLNHDFSPNCIKFQTRYEFQVFQRNISDSSKVDIHTYSPNLSSITMDSMTGEHWYTLRQTLSAAKFFQEMLFAYAHLPSSSSSTFETYPFPVGGTTVYKKLILSATMDNFAKHITAGIEQMDVFKNLSPEDQLIVLKEGLVPVAFLVVVHLIIRQHNAFVFSALEDKISFCVHLNGVDEELNHGMFQLFSEGSNTIYEFLRLDFFVISHVCLLSVFSDYSGLSCNFEKQRSLLTELLEKYVQAKVSGGHWLLSTKEIMDNISKVVMISRRSTATIAKFSKKQEMARKWYLFKKPEVEARREYYWLKKIPASNMSYDLVKLKGDTCLQYNVIIELYVREGLIEGTNCSFEKLLSGEESLNTITIQENPSLLLLTGRDGHVKVFQRLTSQQEFHVIVKSSLSKTVTQMSSMTDALWNQLSLMVSASTLIRNALSPRYQLISLQAFEDTESTSISPEQHEYSRKQIQITVGYEKINEMIGNCLNLFSSLSLLSPEEKKILQTEAVAETILIQMTSSFERESSSFIQSLIRNHLSICSHLDMFPKDTRTESAHKMFSKMLFDFDDFLRKDDFVITILSLLCLIQERAGINSCKNQLQQQRTLFLSLLDRYIQGKVLSRDWITAVDVIWSHIHSLLSTVSNMKSLVGDELLPLLSTNRSVSP